MKMVWDSPPLIIIIPVVVVICIIIIVGIIAFFVWKRCYKWKLIPFKISEQMLAEDDITLRSTSLSSVQIGSPTLSVLHTTVNMTMNLSGATMNEQSSYLSPQTSRSVQIFEVGSDVQKSEKVVIKGKEDKVVIKGKEDKVVIKGKEDKVVIKGKEDKVVIKGKEDKVVIKGKEDKVVIKGKEDKVVFKGKEDKVVIKGKEDKVVIKGQEDKVVIKGKEDKVVIKGKEDKVVIKVQEDKVKDINDNVPGNIVELESTITNIAFTFTTTNTTTTTTTSTTTNTTTTTDVKQNNAKNLRNSIKDRLSIKKSNKENVILPVKENAAIDVQGETKADEVVQNFILDRSVMGWSLPSDLDPEVLDELDKSLSPEITQKTDQFFQKKINEAVKVVQKMDFSLPENATEEEREKNRLAFHKMVWIVANDTRKPSDL